MNTGPQQQGRLTRLDEPSVTNVTEWVLSQEERIVLIDIRNMLLSWTPALFYGQQISALGSIVEALEQSAEGEFPYLNGSTLLRRARRNDLALEGRVYPRDDYFDVDYAYIHIGVRGIHLQFSDVPQIGILESGEEVKYPGYTGETWLVPGDRFDREGAVEWLEYAATLFVNSESDLRVDVGGGPDL